MSLINIPTSPEMEKILLALMIIFPEFIKKAVYTLIDEDFYNMKNRKIYQALKKMWERKEPIDLALLFNFMSLNGDSSSFGGAYYLSSLLDGIPFSMARHFEVYCYRLRAITILRQIVEKCYRIADGWKSPAANISESLLELREMIEIFCDFNSAIKMSREGHNGNNEKEKPNDSKGTQQLFKHP